MNRRGHAVQFAAMLRILLLLFLTAVAAAQNNQTAGPARVPAQAAPASPSRGAGPVAPAPPPNTHYVLRCGSVIDGVSAQPRRNAEIVVDQNKITEIRAAGANSGNAQTIDLSRETCLPGLIDVHSHVLLQGDIIIDYDEQLLKESTAYRAIRATVSVKNALNFGFTGLRDLETEGAGYADVDVRNAIDRGIIPGPRMQVATRALNVTGAYALLGYNWEYEWPHGVQVCDGAEGCRKAVREQISHGADWIKVYADQSTRTEGSVLHSRPTFTIDELRAIVDEAHRERHRVAAHASGMEGVHDAVAAGVDTVEHGTYIAPEDIQQMVAKGIWFVPTPWLAYYRAEQFPQQAQRMQNGMKIAEDTFRRAMAAGVKMAYGTDVGAFEWTITPAMQFPTMVKYGMTPMQAIQSATVRAAELLNWRDRLGSIEAGKLADVIAVPNDPLADISALQHVDFVMKDGTVYKRP